jgi:hypothetical protein
LLAAIALSFVFFCLRLVHLPLEPYQTSVRQLSAAADPRNLVFAQRCVWRKEGRKSQPI